MDFILLDEGITASLIPIFTLIEHKSEHIVGCILLGQDQRGKSPDWFLDSLMADNPAKELLKADNPAKELLKADNNKRKLPQLDVFLIVKEPDSLLQLTVLCAIDCCNLNVSGEGGIGGRKLLELLVQHNIRTYVADIEWPSRNYDSLSPTQWHETVRGCFENAFKGIAKTWLPQSWGVTAIDY